MKIMANTVTLARIALLPIPCAFLLYGGMCAWWISLILFSLLGATDFIDGIMARRDGPTRLGGLIDPIADKIFVAAVALSFTSVGFFGSWFPILILSREFILISLRASVAFRGEIIKTSKLGKIKTIYQMGGLATIFLSLALPINVFIWFCFISSGIIFLFWFFLFLFRSPPYWLLPVVFVLFLVAIFRIFLLKQEIMIVQAIIIVGITWISGINYLFSSFKFFKKNAFKCCDFLRLFWALSCSVLLVYLLDIYHFLLIPILFFISFELALGGVDAIIAEDKKYVGSKPFIFSTIVAVLIFLIVFANYLRFISLNVLLSSIVAAILSGLSFIVVFMKWHKFFKKSF